MARVAPDAVSADPYKNPELFRWLDSMEGVPEWVDPAETLGERAGWAPWQHRSNHLFELAGTTLPGFALAVILAWIGGLLADWLGVRVLGFAKTPLSPILLAIGLGLVIRNTIGLPAVYEAGLQLTLKRLLRLGVALLGIRLSLAAVGSIGLVAAPIVIGCIAAALLLVTWVARAFGVPPRLGTLIAVGTAICGNTAIVATAPVIGAKDDEVSYAVGCVTVFGLIALIVYPYLAEWIFSGDAQLAGLFLGTAIHDTAQVAGAGMVYQLHFGSPDVLDTATVTKLLRNSFMLVVIPLMAFYYRRSEASATSGKADLRQALPLFVFGFLAMSLLRTLGDLGSRPFGFLSPESWTEIISATGELATWCLVVAMASVGLGTSFSRLRTLGIKPLAVGLVAATLVGVVSFVLVRVVGPALSSL